MLKLFIEPHQEPSVSDVSQPIKPASDLADSIVLDGFLRREELARQLGVSSRTIDRWQSLRVGPPRLRCGRTILYNTESVREWLRSQEEQPSMARRQRNPSRKEVG